MVRLAYARTAAGSQKSQAHAGGEGAFPRSPCRRR
jgi:hypothetical protein